MWDDSGRRDDMWQYICFVAWYCIRSCDTKWGGRELITRHQGQLQVPQQNEIDRRYERRFQRPRMFYKAAQWLWWWEIWDRATSTGTGVEIAGKGETSGWPGSNWGLPVIGGEKRCTHPVWLVNIEHFGNGHTSSSCAWAWADHGQFLVMAPSVGRHNLGQMWTTWGVMSKVVHLLHLESRTWFNHPIPIVLRNVTVKVTVQRSKLAFLYVS